MTMDNDADQLADWLEQIALGEKRPFDLLYQATSGKLYGLCLRILREEGRAQECLQEIYLTVWRKADRFDRRKASAMTWLAAITHHRAISLARRFRREITPDDWTHFLQQAERPGSGTTQANSDTASDWQLLSTRLMDDCLDDLNQGPKAALAQAFWEGLSYPEIAERLTKPLNTVKSWVRRALMELRRCIERTGAAT